MYKSKEDLNNRLREHYKATTKVAKHEVFGVFLQGSQNYIDDKFLESSDVDSRALLLPSKRDIILGRNSSGKTLLVGDEHVDIYDIRKAFGLLLKASINNYEMLYTDYASLNKKYLDQYKALLEIREEIVRKDEKEFVMSVMGMSLRQVRFINKEDKDYRKSLAHVLRLNKTLKAYIAGNAFEDCLKAMDQDLIYKIRTTDLYSLEEAIELGQETDRETTEIAKAFQNKPGKDASQLIEKVNNILVDLVSASMGA